MSVSIYDGTNDELDKIAGREDTSFWEGTQAQWDALSSSEKAEWTGKYVIITDDEEDFMEELYYSAGTYTVTTGMICGFPMNSGKQLTLSARFPKNFIEKPTINSIGISAKGISGNIDNFTSSGTNIDLENTYNLTCRINNANTLELNVTRKDGQALSNTTSLTPVVANVIINFTVT